VAQELQVVSDASDPRLAPFRHLNEPSLRDRIEAAEGIFIAEGPGVVADLVGSRFRVRSVLLDSRRRHELQDVLDRIDAPILVASGPVIEGVAGFPFHRGVLAAVDRGPGLEPDQVVAGVSTVVVAEALNDHENLGALFRNARALGAGAVLLCPRCADPLYRRSVRVSMGAVLHLPYARLAHWPAGLGRLRGDGFTVLALTPDPAAGSLEALSLAPGERVALVVGAEGPGLTPAALGQADRLVRIPMSGGTDSLNVSTAAAIALYRLDGIRRE